ncbi:MAG: hypothetical protein A2Y62_07185 [Candidatus Fischerbacteria bacterium RBG_13_37_8]|uniref:Uncharacterized protein n=1 Tax=Candidatus Fischerbacteria bacterium RBG_13_37_8 TaxID=1817863 RepID=A0A1F5VV23_9BACT|nr:MAG: hypothetical protein A2Y62_07185 [Candidatus Fischerbacteria bacterium RBG_13_37_8]
MNTDKNKSIIIALCLMILSMAVVCGAETNKIMKFIPDRDSEDATMLKFEVRYVYAATTTSTQTAYITAVPLGNGRDEIRVKCKPAKIKEGRNTVTLTMEYDGKKTYEEGKSIRVIMFAGNEDNILAKEIFDYDKIWSNDPDYAGEDKNAITKFTPVKETETVNKLEFKVEYINNTQRDKEIYLYAYPVTANGSIVMVKTTQMKIDQKKGVAVLVLEYAGKESQAVSSAITVKMAVKDSKGNMQDFASTEFKYSKTWSVGETWVDDGSSLPKIIEFKADNVLILRGTCTVLHWKVQNASKVFLNKVQMYGFSNEVCPETNANYFLVAANQRGETQPAMVMIRVVLK